jgi:hypothetical protein
VSEISIVCPRLQSKVELLSCDPTHQWQHAKRRCRFLLTFPDRKLQVPTDVEDRARANGEASSPLRCVHFRLKVCCLVSSCESHDAASEVRLDVNMRGGHRSQGFDAVNGRRKMDMVVARALTIDASSVPMFCR